MGEQGHVLTTPITQKPRNREAFSFRIKHKSLDVY
jgi:hypothetical protein